MRKLLSLLFFLMMVSGSVFGQTKFAVFTNGDCDESTLRMVESKVVNALVATGKYQQVDYSEAAMNSMKDITVNPFNFNEGVLKVDADDKDIDKQGKAAVDAVINTGVGMVNKIMEMARKSGAERFCNVTVNHFQNEKYMYISCQMSDMNDGKVIGTGEGEGSYNTPADLGVIVDAAVAGILGVTTKQTVQNQTVSMSKQQHPTPPANGNQRPPMPPANGDKRPPMPPVSQDVQEAVTPCDEATFNGIKSMVGKESFSSDKMEVAQQATKGEHLTANQIRQVAELFEYESDRLEYLKFAYKYCYDQNKYYLVNQALQYSSSKDELKEELGL